MSSREHEQSAEQLRDLANDLIAARRIAWDISDVFGPPESEALAKVDQAMTHISSATALLREAACSVEQTISISVEGSRA